jgi:sulfoxide reductase heme-binding subunit YedZ
MKELWYLSRGTGIVSLALLSLVLVLGVLTRSARPLPGLPRFVTAGLHRNASLLAVAFLGVHIGTAVVDPYALTGVLDVVVPFHGGYRPLWVGLGTLAFDVLLALTATSLLRRHLNVRVWRTVHWAAYACWPLAVLHGLGAGTDAWASWSRAITVSCVLAVAAAVGWRSSSPAFVTPQGATR